MTSPRSTQKITDKVEPKDEFLVHGDIKDYYKPWSNECKLRALSSDYAENLNSNPIPDLLKSGFSFPSAGIVTPSKKIFSIRS